VSNLGDTYQQFRNETGAFEVYNPITDEWDVLPPMPTPRVGPAAAAVDGKIYVIGGFNRDTWSPNPVVEIYDIKNGTWSTGPSKPTPCSWAKAVALGGKIYVLGGVGYEYYNVCEVLDPSNNTWTSCAPFSGGRYLHTAVATNGKIYLIGGRRHDPDVWYHDIQEYDPITNSWTPKAPMPQTLYPSQIDAVVVNNKIYVFGRDNEGKSACLIYDITTDQWFEATSDHNSAPSFSVALWNDTAFRFGGGEWGPTLNITEAHRFSGTPPPDTVPPALVQDFSASDGENGQSTLRWVNPPDDDLARVIVRRKTDGYPSDHTDGNLVYQDTSPTPGALIEYVDAGLTNGTTYYYAVFSCDAAGNWNDQVVEGKNADTAIPGTLENHPPDLPAALFQLLPDGTEIPVGGQIDTDTVVFKATLTDPDGDRVKLQVELRRLDELGGGFDETQGGLKESDFVASGEQATCSASGLIPADYHWRARAIDEHGLASEWVEFGNNLTSDVDFSVIIPTVCKVHGTGSSLAIRDFNIEEGHPGQVIKRVIDGWVLEVLATTGPNGLPVIWNGYTWWRVKEGRYEEDPQEGWVASEFLEAVQKDGLSPPLLPGYFQDDGTIKGRLEWAESQLGQRKWIKNGVTYCLRFVREVFDGSRSWWCAKDAFEALRKEGRVYTPEVSWNPPPGAVLFFDINNPYLFIYGHVGVYMGGGVVIHIYKDGSPVKTKLNEILHLYPDAPYTFLGWSFPDVFSPFKVGDEVRCSGHCRIRENPGLSAAIKKVLSPGDSVMILENEKNWIYRDGYHWWYVKYGPNPDEEGWCAETSQVVRLNSSGELRVYDSSGRVTGWVQGELVKEIPFSSIGEQKEILLASLFPEAYQYEVVGVNSGTYELEVKDSEDNVFTAFNMPITPDQIHRFSIDWDALARGEDGVVLQVDTNGDGIFEQIFQLGSEVDGSTLPIGGEGIAEELRITNVLNYPNPCSSGTTFIYNLSLEAQVRIEIYTLAGQLIKVIEPASGQVGYNEQYWDGTDDHGFPLDNGVYIYRIVAEADGKVAQAIGRLVILR